MLSTTQTGQRIYHVVWTCYSYARGVGKQFQCRQRTVHALPQMQEDTDKILNNMKMNTEQLNKKEKIAANRLAKMRKQ